MLLPGGYAAIILLPCYADSRARPQTKLSSSAQKCFSALAATGQWLVAQLSQCGICDA